MVKLILTFAILILSANTLIFADDNEQVITLKDGSQIKGVLSGIDNGVYTVKTPIIGDVHVAANDVVSINSGSAPAAALPATDTSAPAASAPAASAPNLDQQIAAGQQRLMSNPQSMAVLQQMAQNPEIMQALQDPALVQAVTNHDYQAVENNPAVQKLIQDPQMKALLQQLTSQQQNNTSS